MKSQSVTIQMKATKHSVHFCSIVTVLSVFATGNSRIFFDIVGGKGCTITDISNVDGGGENDMNFMSIMELKWTAIVLLGCPFCASRSIGIDS